MFSKIYRKSVLFESYKNVLLESVEKGIIKEGDLESLCEVFDRSIAETFESLKTEKNKKSKNNNISEENSVDVIQANLISFKNLYKVWNIKLSDVNVKRKGKMAWKGKYGNIFGLER